MRAEPDAVNFGFPLKADPTFQYIFCEYASLQEKIMIFFQGIQRALQAARDLIEF
jgi:hypothetical protein